MSTLCRERGFPALDVFRLCAALMVVAIHTAPLESVSVTADFLLTRVLCRLAVPFFFLCSGFFLERGGWRSAGHLCRKVLLLYAAAAALYLPLNFYALWKGGVSPGPALLSTALKKLLVTGTFYHLWYLPALVLGVGTALALRRLGPRSAGAAAGALYAVGVLGDSWYGLAAAWPPARAFYGAVFAAADYTRSGLFFAPLFLLLGARMARGTSAGRPAPRKGALCAAWAASLALMTAEAWAVRALGWPAHDSMYFTLPLCAGLLFRLLLACTRGEGRILRALCMPVYIVHPWCIALVRGAAKALGMPVLTACGPLFFTAVCGLSLAAAALFCALCRAGAAHRAAAEYSRGRCWREVDLAAVQHNARELRRRLPAGCRLMAVVKADAYGHGAGPVARALQRDGTDAFAVATAAEGAALRKAGVRGTVLVLGWTGPAQVRLLARRRLTQAVADETHARALQQACQKARVRLQVHLALDTGMHRLGIDAADTAAARRIFTLSRLRVTGVFSHLCAADEASPAARAFTQRQAVRFEAAVQALRAAGLSPGLTHLCASYGMACFSDGAPAGRSPVGEASREGACGAFDRTCGFAKQSAAQGPASGGAALFYRDAVRAGIALYGVWSDDSHVPAGFALRPALCLKARIASVRTLRAGEGAGYGLAFTAARPTRLATAAIGYADGLPRAAGGSGAWALVHGRRAPIVGRVCMDQLLLDVTDAGPTAPGDTAVFIGSDGGETVTALCLAGLCGTIANELLSRLSPRVPIVYTGQE